ncbi:MAG: EAL domain-containing protein [Actinobacteria bacterium]|nr:EAL domain-containing protein [Actinomycetota bacterium]
MARALDGHLTAAYQPIVDLGRRRVVGYEALLRYRGDHAIPAPVFAPARLLASAERIGQTVELEEAALREALRARDELPCDTSLFVNISVSALVDQRVTDLLRAQGALDGLVFELHHRDTESLKDLGASIAALRDRGAAVAIADSTMQPETLELLLRLGPRYFKIDQRLIAGVSGSRSKLAVVDSLRHLGEALDMSVVAQGIEHLADLNSLDRLGIAFGQGFLIARPAALGDHPTGLSLLEAKPTMADAGRQELAVIVEPVCELTESELDTPLLPGVDIEFEVIVSELREPLALLRRRDHRVANVALTIVSESHSARQAIKIALGRHPDARFEPMVCVDQFGACTGVVRVDRLIDLLLTSTSSGHAVTAAGPKGHSPRRGYHSRRH